jgi:hypothetical protein
VNAVSPIDQPARWSWSSAFVMASASPRSGMLP